jgi:hypothetical protein
VPERSVIIRRRRLVERQRRICQGNVLQDMPVERRAYLGLKLFFNAIAAGQRSCAHESILCCGFRNIISYRVAGCRERQPGIPSDTAGINFARDCQDQVA